MIDCRVTKEAKAKTREQLYDEYYRKMQSPNFLCSYADEIMIPFADAQKELGERLTEQRNHFLGKMHQQKSEYQKEIEKLKDRFDDTRLSTNDDLLEQNEQLKAKIEAAKPIIEKWCKECEYGSFGDCQNDCGVHDLKALLFPQKEKRPVIPGGGYDAVQPNQTPFRKNDLASNRNQKKPDGQ